MARCSFGKISTRGLFQAKWPYGTDLYGRMLYLASGGQKALLCAFDFLGTFPADAARFRRGVSLRTGIPAENIWYHELQVHAAPSGPELTGEVMEGLIERTAEEALRLMERAVPFSCAVAEADLGARHSMNREQYVAGLGGVTVWSGMSFDERGRPYSQNPDIMLLRGYHPDLPVFDRPIYFDNPVDQKAYLFVFSDESGKVIGTLSRFAAHPDVAVLFELRGVSDQYRYNFDWPGYLSEHLEEAFHAPSLYLNGPCADLSAKKGFEGMDTYEACAEEARRIGRAIAAELLDRFQKKRVTLGNPDRFRCATFSFQLPMRDNLPYSRAEMPDRDSAVRQADSALENAIEGHWPAYRIKQLIDDRFRAATDDSMILEICGFDDETLGRHTVSVDVAALALGDYLFIGVPGESLVDMTYWLRAAFSGVKTVPVDQVDGYYNYLATPTSLTLGGYTYWSSWVTRDSIPLLKEGILREMEGFLEGL